jgi:hypothetical protein
MPNASDQTILRSTIFALMLLLVAGCAAVKSPDQGIVPDAPLKEAEGIVFGILATSSYDSKGDKLAGVDIDYDIRFGSSSSRLTQQFELPNIERMFRGNTSTPRLFARRLPAGDYYIFELTRGRGKAFLDGRFTVAPNRATYIGSLEVEFRGAKGLFGEEMSASRIAVKVTNDLENALRQYKEKNPRLAYEITTNLMVFGKWNP